MKHSWVDRGGSITHTIRERCAPVCRDEKISNIVCRVLFHAGEILMSRSPGKESHNMLYRGRF